MMLREGDHIESYTLVSKIGGGGFASVWSARDTATGDDVALKILHANHAYAEGADGAVRERFLAEAKLLQQISHPGVVRVVKIIEAPALGIYAFAMEYLRGYDLYALIGKLEVEKLVGILARTAEILDELHDLGIVHRDLKLSNIFITAPDGSPAVKIIDFGIAESISAAGNSAVTTPQRFIGTIQMMPPESMRRMNGEPIALTAAVDQWAFGVAMYHALTGRLPFHGRTVIEQIEQVLGQPHPPPMFMRAYKKPMFPPELSAILDRCLAKDPAARYPSMAAVAGALRRWVRSGEEGRVSDTLDGGPAMFDEPTESFTRPRSFSTADTSLEMEMPMVRRVPTPLPSSTTVRIITPLPELIASRMRIPTPVPQTIPERTRIPTPVPQTIPERTRISTPIPRTSPERMSPERTIPEPMSLEQLNPEQTLGDHTLAEQTLPERTRAPSRIPTPLPELVPARVFARREPRENDTPRISAAATLKAPARAVPLIVQPHPVAHSLSVFWATLGVILVGVAAYLVGWVSS